MRCHGYADPAKDKIAAVSVHRGSQPHGQDGDQLLHFWGLLHAWNCDALMSVDGAMRKSLTQHHLRLISLRGGK